MTRPPTVWIDGTIRAPAGQRVPVLGSGFAHGRGVFETIRLEAGRPIALNRHLARLIRSAPRIGLSVPGEAQLRMAVADVASARGDEPVSRLRIQLAAAERDGVTLVVSASAAPPVMTSMSALLAPWVRNERSALAGIKATCYADSLLALEWAQARGADEALLADTRDRLSEGSLSNVFVSLDGRRLLTPALSTGALPGICREQLLEWAPAAGLVIEEAELPVAALAQIREGFLTNSLRGVVPLSVVAGRALPVPGPLTAQVGQLYASRYSTELT